MLSGYFNTHNPLNLLIFSYCLFCFDVLGWGFCRALKIRINPLLRFSIWNFGLGIAILLIFLSHFYFPLTSYLTYLVVTIPAYFFLSDYLKEQELRRAFKIIMKNRSFFILLAPLGLYFYIKTALPPYVWDEMAYHYYSPFKIINEGTWSFSGLYQNAPRLLDTSFVAMFALTKTYTTARLLHLTIYLSTLFSLYLFVKKYISTIAALIGIFLLSYASPSLLLDSTLGYVDVGTACYMILAIVTYYMYLRFYRSEDLFAFSCFLALTLGSKYSAISISVILVVLLPILIKLQKKRYPSFPTILFLFFIFLSLGGYWYLKNYLVTGNPVYPFIMPCRYEDCSSYNQGFFFWAMKINLHNFVLILRRITVDYYYIPPVLGLLVAFALFFSKKESTRFTIFILGLFVTDYLLSGKFAGFERRYFYHWRMMIMIVMAIGIYSVIRIPFQKLPMQVMVSIAIPIVIISMVVVILKLKAIYRNYLANGYYYSQTRYAFGRMSIGEWIKKELPETYYVVDWCDKQKGHPHLSISDPSLIWYTMEAQFHIFLEKCSHGGKIRPDQNGYFVSLDECRKDPPLRTAHETDEQYQMRLDNRLLVCQSQEIQPNLYYFKAK